MTRLKEKAPAAEPGYGDLLVKQRPSHAGDAFSRRHPKMPRSNRAKLFAPFAALTGFDAAIRSKEVPYAPRRIPRGEAARQIDEALNLLYRATCPGGPAHGRGVPARVRFFEVCSDVHHEAFGREGLYRTLTGPVLRVDPVARTLTLGDRDIPFSDLYRITRPSGAPFSGRSRADHEGGMRHGE